MGYEILLTLVRMTIIKKFKINAGEGIEKKELSYTVGRNINWVQLLWRTVWRFLKKLKIELPYNLAIPLLGIHPEKAKIPILKVTCTPIFVAAVFTIADTWKQPSTHTHTMEYYSAIKRMKYCHLQQHGQTWRLLYLVESEKDKYYMISLICRIQKIHESIYKTETD